MKKRIPLLILALVCLGIVLCVVGFHHAPTKTGESTPESAVQEKAEPTVILVEESFRGTAEELPSIYREAFRTSAPEIRFQTIPAEESQREIFNTKMRIEIMAGGGPDAYLLSCGDCQKNRSEMLFASPESAMRSRLFYPLDDFIAEAEHFNPEQLNEKILALGQTDEGQMLLPLTYTYPVAWVKKSELKKVDSLTWEDIVSGKSKSLKWSVDRASDYPIGFSFLFPELADWERDNLLITREELAKRIEEKNTLQPLRFDESLNGSAGYALLNYWMFLNNRQKNLAYLPLCNEDETITAAVTLYAAINANASPEKAKTAFSLFDFMLSDELVSGEGFYVRTVDTPREEGIKVYVGQTFYSSLYASPISEQIYSFVSGISVKDRDGFLEGSFKEKPKGSMEAIREFRDRIGHVRFYSSVDAALNKMILDAYLYEETENAEELADRTYDTLLMILAES